MAEAPRHSVRNRRLEVAIAIIISAAGLTTSWASYQSALWSGLQTMHYGLASAQRVKSTRLALDANVNRSIEGGLFNAWLEAKEAGNPRLADFYKSRFPTEFGAAFSAWMAQQPFENPAAATSPFAMPGFRQPGLNDADAMEASADEEFRKAMRDNQTADSFARCATILATAMFFGGIAGVFRTRRIRYVLAFVALLACGFGLIEVANLPTLVMPPAGAHGP